MVEGKRLVAVKPLRYARRDMAAGEVFYAVTIDASYLMRTGKAKPADEMTVEPVLVAAAAMETATVPDEPQDPPRRRYVRRAVVAPQEAVE